MTTSARLQELIEPIVTGLGLELFDLQFSGSTLSVLVDRPRSVRADGTVVPRPPGARTGVDLDAITKVTRAISRALDEADPITAHYALEVSSPGLERPLRTPAHFAGAVGEIVAVKTVATFDGPRRLKGELVRAPRATEAEPSLDVRVDGTVRTVALAQVDKARTVFEWGPGPKPPAPGRPKGGSRAASEASRPTAPAGPDGPERAEASRPPVSPGPADASGDGEPPSDPPPPGAEHSGSATLHEPDAMINGDDQKVSAT